MQSKIYLCAIIAIIAFIGLTMTDSNADYVCGDANSDGSLNVSDAIYIANYVFIGGPVPDPNCCESDCPPIVVDIDGNTYFTVKIGDQCWMAQNLKVTHYRNEDPIHKVTDGGEWGELLTGACCEYNNDPSNVATYGRLYNWYAIDDSRNIAPEGWHVPSDTEWKQLEMYLGMSQAEADAFSLRGTDEGGKLKEAGTTHWYAPNTGATNEMGFTALPGGTRSQYGVFGLVGEYAIFWTSSDSGSDYALARILLHNSSQVGRGGNDNNKGYSVRCVKD